MRYANIDWRMGQPFSLDFDDIYYSSDDGLAETGYVFIQHNQLTKRFSKLTTPSMTIIETGFGTGLNFFCAAQHFLAHAQRHKQLIFISIERYPLNWQDFQRANQHWGIFEGFVQEMQGAYLQMHPGLNLIKLCHGRIILNLYIGDISDQLKGVQTNADAWFLDGFAPAKNSSMWSPNLFSNMSRLSNKNATFATFTSAGHVRRALLSIGFRVSKAHGYGKKREMLYGCYA